MPTPPDQRRLLVLALLAVGLMPVSSSAVWIDLHYDHEASSPPASDPDGLRLAHVMDGAVARYREIFRDEWFVHVRYKYGSPSSNGNLGSAAILTTREFDPAAHPGKVRPFIAEITFNSGVDWYFDETAYDDAEFQLRSVLYRDLAEGSRSFGLTGVPPASLEVGVTGPGSSVSGYDALSVALHELGHIFGVTSNRVETADGDFDFPPEFIHGSSAAATTFDGDLLHLALGAALMNPSLGPGRRALPSAVDVFAMASTAGWQQIDLPRKEFWGGADWHQPINWSGGRIPDTGDDVFVRAGTDVGLTRDAAAGRLFLDEGARLGTAGHDLTTRELHLGNNTRLDISRSILFSEQMQIDPTATFGIELQSGPSSLGWLEQVNLAGTLEISLADGYVPAIGDVQRILVAQNRAGTFDRATVSTELPLPGMDLLLEWELQTGGLEILTAHVVLEGDTNADGRVDQADLDAILLGWGEPAPAAVLGRGDLSGNGLIEQADLDRVLLNWGAQLPVRAAIATTQIPEPSGAVLAAILFLLLVRRLRV